MDNFERFSIWKQKGCLKQKILYSLSYLMIYPFWRAKEHNKIINDNLELMHQFRNCIFESIKTRQSKVNVFKNAHKSELKQNQIDLCDVIINEQISFDNMIWIELEIEGLMNLIYSNKKHLSGLLFKQLRDELYPSELEVTNLIQAYTTFYITIVARNKKFPWNQLMKTLNIQKMELIK